MITDVVMPRMDGHKLVEQTRERNPEIRVIFISGYAEEAFRADLDGEGEVNFLPKPFQHPPARLEGEGGDERARRLTAS